MKISKQKKNLIFKLSYQILLSIEKLNDNTELSTLYKKTNIKTLIHIVKSSHYYTNKEIQELISEYIRK